MVTASVLGAAGGAGLALFIGITLVIYRYYLIRRQGKEWASVSSASQSRQSRTPYCPSPNSTIYIPPQKEFNLLQERCQVQPKLVDARSSNLGSSLHGHVLMPSPLDSPRRRASSCSIQLPRLLSVDEDRPPPQSLASERRASMIHRCMSPLIRAISPDGSASSLLTDSSPTDCYPPQSQISCSSTGRSLSVESASPSSTSNTPEPPRSPAPYALSRGNTLALCQSQPSASQQQQQQSSQSMSQRGRPLSPLLLPKSPTGSDSSASNVSPGAASPIGAIQPDLYSKKDTILMNSQGDGGSSNLGRLHFRLKYDFHRSDLVIHVIEAHDLALSESGGFNDPYVKVSIVPEVDAKSRQTKIHRKSPNPYFNEVFKFPVALDELTGRCLLLQVFDFDKFSRNDVIGEVRISMCDVDVTSDVEVWSEIRRNTKPPGEKQELLFSLSYLPSAERLTVVVLKARNLVSTLSKENLNPYVKIYLVQDGKRIKKKKTTTRRGSDNPVWNEAVAFNVPAGSLAVTCLELRVLNSDQALGCCVVGPKERGNESEHWNDMVQSMRKSVAMWHTLK